jgi:magnesium chelatase family protein
MTSMLDGIHAIFVRVEVDISTGLPAFDMVGYLSSEVREARERVRTALHNCGIVLPAKRITVNLSPADIKKTGTGFDLPIAVALLMAMEVIPPESCEGILFSGELNLKGQLLPVRGMLPIVSDGMKNHMQRYVVPLDNRREAQLVKDAKICAFSTLPEVIAYLRGGTCEESPLPQILGKKHTKQVDFSEVNGQTFLRRSAEIAASGMHNMLMVGPPGAGKTMISERMATILPPLTEEEQLEVSKIYSVCGWLGDCDALLSRRPFRSPHHTITTVGLSGGGVGLRPGEISLAHHGVLFLDELTEFSKPTLEILRQPLEEHRIHLVRASGSVSYPCDFLLLASMNPCNCGYYPDMNRCRCTPNLLRRYFGRISQPLLDRMDICVEAPNVSYEELTQKGQNESSETIRERVLFCHEIQQKRYRGESFCHNSSIPASRLSEYCRLGDKQQRYMEQMYEKMALTARTYHKILRVARTIADTDQADEIRLSDLQEAICYRSLTDRFWGGMR